MTNRSTYKAKEGLKSGRGDGEGEALRYKSLARVSSRIIKW